MYNIITIVQYQFELSHFHILFKGVYFKGTLTKNEKLNLELEIKKNYYHGHKMFLFI